MLIAGFEDFRGETREHYKKFDEILLSHSRRIRGLENFRWWLVGIGATLGALLSWLKFK